MTDPAIVRDLGAHLRRLRLARNLSQAALARRAGVSRNTVVQLEGGRPATLLTLVQLLRALDRLDLLEGFRAVPTISPLRVLTMAERERQRASAPRAPKGTSR